MNVYMNGYKAEVIGGSLSGQKDRWMHDYVDEWLEGWMIIRDYKVG